MPYLSPVGNEQQNDANGAPLSGGFVYTYQAGTTTPQATYTDSGGGTAQANPIVLNSSGLPASPIWLPNGQAVKLVIQNAAGVTQRTVDNITGINDPAGAASLSEWVTYSGAVTYISATSFSVAGDQTGTFQVNRRIKTVNTGGTRYGTITSASYSIGLTTLTVLLDSGSLDSGLSAVSYGLFAANNPSAPPFTYSTSPYRNVLTNGDMRIDQRNAGTAQTFTAGAALAYCVDRWYGYCTGANVTGQQITQADGSKRYKFNGAASVTGIGFGQRIEAADSLHLAGGPVTLSVKLSNSLLTSVGFALYYASTADSFGTLAAPTRTLIASGNLVGVSATEGTFAMPITLPVAATTGLELVLTTGAQTSGTWTVGDVQIERGTVAVGNVVFERLNASQTLQRCQRYFEKSFLLGTAPAQNVGTAAGSLIYAAAFVSAGSAGYSVTQPFKVTKRTAPTMTYYNPFAANAFARNNTRSTDATTTADGNSSEGNHSPVVTPVAGWTVGDAIMVHWTASAEL